MIKKDVPFRQHKALWQTHREIRTSQDPRFVRNKSREISAHPLFRLRRKTRKECYNRAKHWSGHQPPKSSQ